MSISSPGSSADHDDRQGARPKVNPKEWNSKWNATFSVQDTNVENQAEGQPPLPQDEDSAAVSGHCQRYDDLHREFREAVRHGRGRFPITRGLSDSSLGPKQLRQPQSNSSNHGSHADISYFSSASSIHSLSKETNTDQSKGLSVLFRWFRRRPRSERPKESQSAQTSPISRRSHMPNTAGSLERTSQFCDGEGGNHISDTLSTASSFAFLHVPYADSSSLERTIHRIHPQVDHISNRNGLTLHRKYGLHASDTDGEETLRTNNAAAIRALRTEWEIQMKEREMRTQANLQEAAKKRNSNSGRKKRPAPPPPSPTTTNNSRALLNGSIVRSDAIALNTSFVSSNSSNRNKSTKHYSFIHVPGKRRAPSPPHRDRPCRWRSCSGVPSHPPPQFNIPPGTLVAAGNPSPFSSLRAQIQTPSLPEITTDAKWNDLNSNLNNDIAKEKVIALGYNDCKFHDPANSQTMQKKQELYDKNAYPSDISMTNEEDEEDETEIYDVSCPRNDILVLKHGVLRPVTSKGRSNSTSTSPLNSLKENTRLTLPLRPWYKRHPSQHLRSNVASPPCDKRKWKEPVNLEEWMPDVPYYRRSVFINHSHTNSSTLKSNSTKLSVKSNPAISEGTKQGSDVKQEKRKSLLANISELDREAAEIIQKEKNKELARKMAQDAKFYTSTSDSPEYTSTGCQAQEKKPEATALPLITSQTEINEAAKPSSARELIQMFNSFNSTRVTVNSSFTGAEIQAVKGNKTSPLLVTEMTQDAINNKTSNPNPLPRNLPTPVESSLPDKKHWIQKDEQLHQRKGLSTDQVKDPIPIFVTSPAKTSIINISTAEPSCTNNNNWPSPTSLSNCENSIFSPKFPLVSTPSVDNFTFSSAFSNGKSTSTESKGYPGGARPKTTLTTESDSDVWPCPVCTLINRNVRLWCEACNSFRPRQYHPPDYNSSKPNAILGPSSSMNPPVSISNGVQEQHRDSSQSKDKLGDHDQVPSKITVRETAIKDDKQKMTVSRVQSDNNLLKPISRTNSHVQSSKWEDEIKKYFGQSPTVTHKNSNATVSTAVTGPVASSASQTNIIPGNKLTNQNSRPTSPELLAPTSVPPVETFLGSSGLSQKPVPSQPEDTKKASSNKLADLDLATPAVPNPEELRQARLAFFIGQTTTNSLNGQSMMKAEDETMHDNTLFNSSTMIQEKKETNEIVTESVQTSQKSSVTQPTNNSVDLGYRAKPMKVSSACQTNLESLRKSTGFDRKSVVYITETNDNPSKTICNSNDVKRDVSLHVNSNGMVNGPITAHEPGQDKHFARMEITANTNDVAVISSSGIQSSCDSLQLAHYVQLCDKSVNSQENTAKQVSQSAVFTQHDDTQEKRISTLLSRLEEAITAGQFDKAAVLAKELAELKKPYRKPETTISTSLQPNKTSNPLQSPNHSKENASKKSGKTEDVSQIAKQLKLGDGNKVPMESKDSLELASQNHVKPKEPRQQIVRKPSTHVVYQSNNHANLKDGSNKEVQKAQADSPHTSIQETLAENTKQKDYQHESLIKKDLQESSLDEKDISKSTSNVNHVEMKDPVSVTSKNGNGEQNTPSSQQKISLKRILNNEVQPVKNHEKQMFGQTQSENGNTRREAVVKTTSAKVKVNSQQQTCISYQGSSKEKIVSFNVEIFIEDRFTHKGPIRILVNPTTSLLDLKHMMQKRHNILVESQRWIFNRRLAAEDQKTLHDYGIHAANNSLFLYLIAPEPMEEKEITKEKTQTKDNLTDNPTQLTSKRYYNIEEDRYSSCDESDTELVELRAAPSSSIQAEVQDLNKMIQEPSPEINKQTLTNTQEDEDWICPQCTLRNPLTRPGCEACATERPAAIQLQEKDIKKMAEGYEKLLNLDQNDIISNADPFDCSVCLMNVPPLIGVTLRDCLHNFCKDCLGHVIEFSEDAVVRCPYRDENYACDSALQEREIKALVKPDVYEKHLARSINLAEKQIKNAFHCQTPNCTGWCVIEDNVNMFRCPVCHRTNCLTCQAIHEGVNCKQYQDQVKEDAESNEDAKRTKEMIEALVQSGEALSCPQCQVVLMKRWGCDWVRCSVCRTEICWVTKQARWGPKGKGDTSGGCKCGVNGIKCHPQCNYCH